MDLDDIEYTWRDLNNAGHPLDRGTFAIDADDPVYQSWDDQIMDRIVNMLEARLTWNSVNVVRTGFGERWHQNPVRVLIYTPDHIVSADLEQEVARICLQFLGPDWNSSSGHAELNPPDNWGLMKIEVKLKQGDVYRFHDMPATNTITCGKSQTGTMGCVVKTTIDGEDKDFGLTCHHVARKGQVPVDDADKITVDRPGNSVHECEIEQVQLSLSRLQNFPQLRQHQQPDLERRLQELKSLDRAFGTVFKSSGLKLRTSIGGTLDWALVKPNAAIDGPNRWYDRNLGDIHLNQTASLNERFTNGIAANDNHAKNKSKVLNLGSTHTLNGSPCGYISGINSAVKLSDGLGEDIITSEWLIVPESSMRPFSVPGDSGALVVTENDLKVVGLVIAGGKEAPWLSYVTPIEDVLADIRTSLNATSCELA